MEWTTAELVEFGVGIFLILALVTYGLTRRTPVLQEQTGDIKPTRLPATGQRTQVTVFAGESESDYPADQPVAVSRQQTCGSSELRRRVDSRLDLLDELVNEADREIEHLTELLEQIRPDSHLLPGSSHLLARRQFDAIQRQMIRTLYLAGFSLPDVARALQTDVLEIQAIIDGRGDQQAA